MVGRFSARHLYPVGIIVLRCLHNAADGLEGGHCVEWSECQRQSLGLLAIVGFTVLLGGTEIGGAYLDSADIALVAGEVGKGAFGKCYRIVGVDVKSLIRDGQFLA